MAPVLLRPAPDAALAPCSVTVREPTVRAAIGVVVAQVERVIEIISGGVSQSGVSLQDVSHRAFENVEAASLVVGSLVLDQKVAGPADAEANAPW